MTRDSSRSLVWTLALGFVIVLVSALVTVVLPEFSETPPPAKPHRQADRPSEASP